MTETDVPEGRCGFELGLSDVDVGKSHVGDPDLEMLHKATGAVGCWRKTWFNDRCILHANTANKPVNEIRKVVENDLDKRFDGAIFENLELNQNISFEEATLLGAIFDGVQLKETNFTDADLRYAKFPHANLQYAKFPRAKIQVAEFPHADLQKAKFSGATLTWAQFCDANLKRAKFHEANLEEAEFPNADLRWSEFPNAELSGAEFPDANVALTEFPDADLWGAKFPDAEVGEAEFSGATLDYAVFSNANLREGKFHNACLKYAEFPDAHLKNAEFLNADVRHADFTHANLEDAVLTGADCRDATFTSALLYETVFAHTRINSQTTFSDSETSFYESIVSRPSCVYEENELINSGKYNHSELQKDTHRLVAAKWVYRRLEALHEENALSDLAREFHISKEEVERKLLWDEDKKRWGVKTTMWWVSRHGESVRNVLYSWAVVIGVCALLFPFVGGVKDSEGNVYQLASSKDLTTLSGWQDVGTQLTTLSGWEDVFINLYFSVITFSTLGYGDLSPHGPYSRTLVALESILGAVLVALLVFVLGRRAAR